MCAKVAPASRRSWRGRIVQARTCAAPSVVAACRHASINPLQKYRRNWLRPRSRLGYTSRVRRKPKAQLEMVLGRRPRRIRRGVRLGRPPRGVRSSERHETRPVHNARHPVHVTCRMVQGLGTLRRRHMYQAIRWATLTTARRENFRIVHLSIQSNHLHLIVEADDRAALARGMQGFSISAAKHIRRSICERTGARRRGSVFADRYHPRALKTPREVRHAIGYVLNNWRRHREDHDRVARAWKIDPYASGVLFGGWKEQEHQPWCFKPPKGYEPLIVWRPTTWLLKTGWTKSGDLISVRAVPGRMS